MEEILERPLEVYNFQVEEDHTYYVCLELIRNNEIHHYHYDFLEPYRKF